MRLLRQLAQRAAAGREVDTTSWLAAKAAETTRLRQVAASLSTSTMAELHQLLDAALLDAYRAGAATATAELQAAGLAAPAALRAGTPEVLVLLLEELLTGAQQAHVGMLRWVDDVFRVVQAEVATLMGTGTLTLPQAVQQSLTRYAGQGVRGFVDTAGRAWGLQEYAEMQTRTAMARAHVNGMVQQVQQAGHNLVIVSASPEPCPICVPWEGEVLSVDGNPGPDGKTYDSLAAAVDDGLLHPNCTHGVGVYVPGHTQPLVPDPDPEAYQLRQQQRGLERRVRAARRAQAVATTQQAQQRAQARLQAARSSYQGFMAQHPERIEVVWRQYLLRPGT